MGRNAYNRNFRYNGFSCKVVKNVTSTMEWWCGYVALPKEHIYYGKGYDDIPIEVHGGLTFAQKGDGKTWDKKYYWIGFDCSHAGDLASTNPKYIIQGDHLWTEGEVIEEVKALVQQLGECEIKEEDLKVEELRCEV